VSTYCDRRIDKFQSGNFSHTQKKAGVAGSSYTFLNRNPPRFAVTFFWRSLCVRRVERPPLTPTPSGGFFRLGIRLGTGPHGWGHICGFVLGEAVTVFLHAPRWRLFCFFRRGFALARKSDMGDGMPTAAAIASASPPVRFRARGGPAAPSGCQRDGGPPLRG
jgi:hypothetical protein